MTAYANNGGDSGIVAYEIGDAYIKVEFESGQWTLYTYTHSSAGRSAVEKMKSLAQAGEGLNSYISTNRPEYSNRK